MQHRACVGRLATAVLRDGRSASSATVAIARPPKAGNTPDSRLIKHQSVANVSPRQAAADDDQSKSHLYVIRQKRNAATRDA